MWKESKIRWLLAASVFVGIFEFLSLAGIQLPKHFAIPFYSLFILLFGYSTIIHGLQTLVRLDFKDIRLLMVIAVAGAFYLGQYPEGAVIIILFTLAEHLEDVGIAKSQSALDSLLNRMPKMVHLENHEKSVPVSEVNVNDMIVVKPAEMIALDGIVRSGLSFVDESAITGEPLAKDKRAGDPVFAGTLNKQSVLTVEVTKRHSDSTIEKIKEMTFKAFKNKAKTEQFIEKFSQYYTPSVLLLAIFWTFFPWLVLHHPFDKGFSEALILIVIACPCALVISTPISIFSAIGNASSSGALIKGGKYLEAIGQIQAIALDKTRTLTFGEPIVTDIVPFMEGTREHLLSCAAGIEALSEHPLAQSVWKAAKKENLIPHAVTNFESIVGKGAKADCLVCDDKHHCIGKLKFILEEHEVPNYIIEEIDRYQNTGKTVIVVSTHTGVEGIIALEDEVRPDSHALVSELKALGIDSIMLTGDHTNVAQSVAQKVGIDQVHAELLPEHKSKAVLDLLKKYPSVAMFGDGVNDAPALAFSSVGISMSSLGSDTALEAASIIILNDRLSLIPFLVRLGRRTLNVIKFNTVFAIAVKFAVIALALAGMNNLALAIFADVGVTLLVILNSLRLMHWKPSVG